MTPAIPVKIAAPSRPCIADLTRGELAPGSWRDAAAAGFGVVLVPSGDVEALRSIAAAGQDVGLAVLVDFRLDRAPAGQVADAGGLFTVLPAPTRDPRRPIELADHAVVALTGPDDAAALASWAADGIRVLMRSGAVGVRLTGLDSLPGTALQAVLGGIRRLCGDAVLFAWTHGLSWEVLQAIQPGTVDLVASSLPYWDGEGEWIWRELDVLRRIAPVVAPVGLANGRYAAAAAVLADGWMAPLPAAADGGGGKAADVAALNRMRSTPGFGTGPGRLLTAPGSAVLAMLRTDTVDPRRAAQGTLLMLNTSAEPADASLSHLLPEAGAAFGPFRPVLPADGPAIGPGAVVALQPHQARLFQAETLPLPTARPIGAESAMQAAGRPRLAIEAPTPSVEGGRFPARRTVGTVVAVEADIIGDGHDKLAAVLRWQAPASDWRETPMALINNDRWTASFPLEGLGVYKYEVHAWRDAFTTYADELSKKHRAGVPIVLELREGAALVAAAAARTSPAQAKLKAALASLKKLGAEAQRVLLLSPELAGLMQEADDRPHLASVGPIPVQAERTAAGFASWYEVFPRSLSDDPDRHGTFRDVERHLPRVQAMGFDVLYFPPFHPIGRVNRKGRNNTLTPTPDDPGSPYAIGSSDGGHDALHPELGTVEDFQHLRAACAEHGLELAMDFAIQCSPDHPWLKQHKDWFTWRPDGTIRYAENPPKKYEDIVNVDFYAPGAVPGLWVELCNVVLYWAGQGVRLFRVDNPHTKPMPFWEWMIAEVQAQYPDAVFLAEAFTRPKVMYRLAKSGFSQSYTYFTWREAKWEFEQYLTELTAGPPRDFFRPHFFVNTPDINPVYLQGAGRGAYLVRAALAATLSGLWGVYNGFELCEGTPVPGKEEYLDSEKYQLRAWDWDRPGNIVAEITQLNAIRRRNPALHSHLGITFLPASGEQVLFFEKASPDRGNVVLVAVSMDARTTQYADLTMPGTDAVDLLTESPVRWSDRVQRIALPPDRPYAIWRLRSGL
ncbi:MAG: alpha-1,4-glucan--maltose-1-phosphate maltosyltransferase [Janthinobacterium lividum]